MEARKQLSKQKQEPLFFEAQHFCKNVFGRCLSWLTESTGLVSLLQGGLIAAIALYWINLFVVTWGESQFNIISLIGGVLLAAFFRRSLLKRIAPEFCSVFLFAATSTSLFWWENWDFLIARLFQYHTVWGAGVAVLLNGLLLGLLIIAIRICSQSAVLFSREEELCKQKKCVGTDEQIPSTIFLGAALGLWLLTGYLTVLFPIYQTTAICSGILLFLFIIHLTPLRCLLAERLPSSLVIEAETNGSVRDKKKVAPSPVFLGVLSICAGWMIPATYRFASQLQPGTTLLFYGVVAAVLVGLACSR